MSPITVNISETEPGDKTRHRHLQRRRLEPCRRLDTARWGPINHPLELFYSRGRKGQRVYNEAEDHS